MSVRFLSTAVLAATIALSAGFVAVRPAAAADVSYDQLATDRGPAIVGLKFLLKVNAPAEMGGPREIQREVTGLMIEKNGLVLCANSAVGGNQADLPPGVTVTPAEMKVLIGEDSEGAAAKVIARDSELDLAWIRIDKPSDKGYTSVDLKQHPAAKLGDRLLFIDRMGNYYDRAIFVGEVKVSAMLKKPRNLIQPGGLIFSLCTPVFAADGQFAGVTVRQGLGRDEMGGAVSQADQLYS
ncbi:MAG: trypsin-like peptidase domain-containing protein, partial [Phycisphaerales bacterium]